MQEIEQFGSVHQDHVITVDVPLALNTANLSYQLSKGRGLR